MTLALEFDQLAPGALWMSVARLDGIAGRAFVLQSNPGMNMDDSILEVVAHEHGPGSQCPSKPCPASDSGLRSRRRGRSDRGGDGHRQRLHASHLLLVRLRRARLCPSGPAGPAPRCSAAALSHASHGPEPGWRPNNLDEWSVLQHGLAAPFTVRQTACADGWALARATQAGKAVLALYEQLGARFACLGVGSAPIMGDNASEDFDIPPSVLRALSARLGARLAPPALLPTGPPPAPGSVTMPAIDTASVELSATPGSSYAGLEVYQEHGLGSSPRSSPIPACSARAPHSGSRSTAGTKAGTARRASSCRWLRTTPRLASASWREWGPAQVARQSSRSARGFHRAGLSSSATPAGAGTQCRWEKAPSLALPSRARTSAGRCQ